MVTKVQFVKCLFAALLCIVAFNNANAVNLVTNPGFETAESTSNSWPSVYGDWNGDYSAIIGSTLGITPVEGSKMLQTLGTSPGGVGSTNSCQIYQLVNISNYQSLIASGNARAEASAYIDRVAGNSQTDTKFDILILAYDGLPSTFPSRWENGAYNSTLAFNFTSLFSDSLPQTWERLDVTLNLPTNTTFLVMALQANEEISNNFTFPEFDGHFFDNVSLQVIPEPSTMILLGAGIVGLLRRK